MKKCKNIFCFVAVMLMFLLVSQGSYAFSVAKVNFDPLVNPMLTASFNVNKALEKKNLAKLQEVREAYEGASLALAGLQEARMLERKWQRDPLSLVYDNAENYYYQGIYELVKNRIIPRIYRVAILCVTVHPTQVEFWLPTLFFVCSDVQELCTEFSNIVTNGQLQFTGITFPQITQELLDGFGISKLKGVDVEKMIDEIVNFKLDLPDIKIKDLKKDFYDIIDFIGALGSDLWDDIGNIWEERTRITGAFESTDATKAKGVAVLKKKLNQVKNSIDSLKTIYAEYHDTFDYQAKLQSVLGALDSTSVMNKLFTYNGLPAEDLENPVDSGEEEEQYYRQKWCIMKNYTEISDEEEKLILTYDPPFNVPYSFINFGGDKEIYYSSWYRYVGSTSFDDLSEDKKEFYLKAALNYAASIAGVSSYMSNDEYRVEYKLVKYNNTFFTDFMTTILSYHFDVYKLPHSEEKEDEVYCEWFDSKTTTEDMMINHMQSKLEEILTGDLKIEPGAVVADKADMEEGVTYKIVQGERHYYSVPDAAHLEGVNSVEFIANCEDGGTLGELQTQRKINEKHSPLNERSKELMMENCDAAKDMETSLNELHKLKQQKNDSIVLLTEELEMLKLELTAAQEIYIHTPTKEALDHVEELQDQINIIEDKISELKSEVAAIEHCEEELVDDYGVEDVGANIPDHIMYYQTQFPSLEWVDDGHWEGYTFVRKAKVKDFGGEITFRAELTAERGESYFLGIRYHRSIIGVHSGLYYESHTEETVGYMEFPKSASGEEKAEKIEERRLELQADYEDCTITIKETLGDGIKTDDGEVVHLLWPSDRLRLARDIYIRLMKIDSRLMLLEMYLHHTTKLSLSWKSIFDNGKLMMTNHHTPLYLNNILLRWRKSAQDALYKKDEEDD